MVSQVWKPGECGGWQREGVGGRTGFAQLPGYLKNCLLIGLDAKKGPQLAQALHQPPSKHAWNRRCACRTRMPSGSDRKACGWDG